MYLPILDQVLINDSASCPCRLKMCAPFLQLSPHCGACAIRDFEHFTYLRHVLHPLFSNSDCVSKIFPLLMTYLPFASEASRSHQVIWPVQLLRAGTECCSWSELLCVPYTWTSLRRANADCQRETRQDIGYCILQCGPASAKEASEKNISYIIAAV